MTRTTTEASSNLTKADQNTDTDSAAFTPDSQSDHPEPFPTTHLSRPPKRRTSQSPPPVSSSISGAGEPEPGQQETSNGHLVKNPEEDEESGNDLDLDEIDGEMSAPRPPMHRPTDGRSHQPLLKDEARGRSSYETPNGSARPTFAARRSTFRSRSPDYDARNATRRKYTFAAFFLGVSLVSFVIQTETAVYIQHKLGWKKAYCMLWLTHGSWSLLWPFSLLILRIQKRKLSFKAFWRRHTYLLRTTAQMVESGDLHLTSRDSHKSPIPYILKTTAFVTTFLTVAGGSWYVAVDLTSPSDLTAIYNCSAFFAYAFSIPLLKDKLRFDKLFSVAVAIAGVLVVAYGDSGPARKTPGLSGGAVGGAPPEADATAETGEVRYRLLGNIIIGIGSVMYGLYEVLYKKYACPPEGTSPGRGTIFAMMFGSCIGCFTLFVLWIPLPILHVTGIEPFEIPTGKAAWMLLISTFSNAIFSGSFLVLISLTSPVLSSVAALLTIFLVAIVDTFLTGVPFSVGAIVGGALIIAAFLSLSWSTYREMDEERRKRLEDEGPDSDSDE